MDWADSPELIEIFQTEIDERAGRLEQGGLALSAGALGSGDAAQMVLDAHTLKGSAHMIGRPDLGEAAAALERTWKAIDQRQLLAASDLGRVIAALAAALKRGASDISALTPFEGTVRRLEEWAAGSDAPSAATKEEAPPGDPFDRTGDESSLGGLLGSVEEQLSASITRVETNSLYRLINRTVELEIEAHSIVDLSYVSIEPADPARLISAWRGQLGRLAGEVAELRRAAVALSNVRFGEAAETFPQFVKFLGRKLDKQVELTIRGGDLPVDRQIVDMLREPLRHLLVNAVDHGIETVAQRVQAGKNPVGRVDVEARLVEGRLLVTVNDDGRGIDWTAVEQAAIRRSLGTNPSELDSHLLRSGFSTVDHPNDFSGTGDGLAAVADAADRVGGAVSISSQPGVGTSVRLDLPSSLVLQRVVVFGVGDQFFGIAESAVLEELPALDVRFNEAGREVMWRRQALPLISFSEAMNLEPTTETKGFVVSSRSGRYALAVSEIIDHRPVAVKGLGPILDDASHVAGAALLGAGEVLVIVDHHHLGYQARTAEHFDGIKPRILVVDDSAGVRQLIAVTLRGKGFEVVPVSGARDAAIEIAHQGFDLLIVDFAMPKSNGVDLVRALRNNRVHVPIVMVSGVADAEEKAAAWDAGVDAYLDKFDLRSGALVTTINRLLTEKAPMRR